MILLYFITYFWQPCPALSRRGDMAGIQSNHSQLMYRLLAVIKRIVTFFCDKVYDYLPCYMNIKILIIFQWLKNMKNWYQSHTQMVQLHTAILHYVFGF